MYLSNPVYRTYPLKDPRVTHQKPWSSHGLPASSELLNARGKLNDTDLALQNLAKLSVTSNGTANK